MEIVPDAPWIKETERYGYCRGFPSLFGEASCGDDDECVYAVYEGDD